MDIVGDAVISGIIHVVGSVGVVDYVGHVVVLVDDVDVVGAHGVVDVGVVCWCC